MAIRRRRERRDGSSAPFLIFVITGLVFVPAVLNGFVWDDEPMLLQNPHYRGLGPRALAWMFTTVHMTHYTPLSWLTLGLDYRIWGMRPAGYHATNVLLHAASAVLVYRIAARLLAKALLRSSAGTRAVASGAFVAALLFALHPLRVESVAWITERRDVLCGFFYLAAILAYLRFCDAKAGNSVLSRRPYLTCLGLTALALLSKSMAVSLPLVFLILDVYPLRRLGGAAGWWSPAGRRVLVEKLPFLLLSAAAGAVQVIALFVSGNVDVVARPGAIGRVAIALYGLSLYLEKTVLPLGLSPLYELYPGTAFLSWPFILRGAVVLAVTVLAVRLRRRWPAILAAFVSYVVILLPVLGTANTFQLAADRYTYLAGIGFALLGGGAVARWGVSTGRAGRRERPRARWLPVAAAMVIVILAALTVWQTRKWLNDEELWTYTLRIDPRSSVADYNLGVIRLNQERNEEALAHFHRAVAGRPEYREAQNNLGLVLIYLGRPDEAVAPITRAVSLKPDWAFAHNNLGLAFLRMGRLNDAAAEFTEAARLAPDLATPQANLGEILLAQGRPAEALERFVRAAALDPSLRGLDEARARAQVALGQARGGAATLPGRARP